MKRKWLAVGIILLFVGTCLIPAIAQEAQKPLPSSRGNWLYVGGSGPGNYSTIQSAVDAANPLDTVFVYDDSSPYYENVVIPKSIIVLGENIGTTIISGGGNGAVFRVRASFVTIKGFTITNGSEGVYITMDCYSNHTTISENIISNNGVGICIDASHNNTILRNTIIQNTHEGIFCLGGITYNNIFQDNNIQDNEFGIWLDSGCWNNTIIGNNLTENRIQSIIVLQSHKNIIERNNIKNISFVFSQRNVIRSNNFIGQVPHLYRWSLSFATWDANYWDDWIGLKLSAPLFQKFPKVILAGFLIQFDWHPAQEPYVISEMS